MSDAMEKLQYDLKVMEVMASNMAGYLKGDTLFGHTGGRMPKLTLGGYLMRQHRLLELDEVLSAADRQRVRQAVETFGAALNGMIVRSEQRAQRELEARIRQWESNVRDIRREARTARHYYGTAVEPRAMIHALIEFFGQTPYQLDAKLLERLEPLDQGLMGVWQPGNFVWQEEWQTAYPQKEYWWLYGLPRILERSR